MTNKSINTLVEDIYSVLTTKQVDIPEETIADFGAGLSRLVKTRLSEEQQWSLRMSNIGEKCLRKLWYHKHHPELAEPLSGPTKFKFLFGDIIEHVTLFLARLAGHDVARGQDEVSLDGIKGHSDGHIDGHLMDVKSASSRSFTKFASGLTPEQDDFGYLWQLAGYYHADGGTSKPPAFLAIDKQLGKIALDIHSVESLPTRSDIEGRISKAKQVLSEGTTPPERGYKTEPEGKSGNLKLGVACSYCSFKKVCWPGLRAFNYSHKPVFLTRVVREPNVPEINL